MTTIDIGYSFEALAGLLIFSIGLPVLFSRHIRLHLRNARDQSRAWTARLQGASAAMVGAAFCVLFVSPLVWTTSQNEAWITVPFALLFLGLIFIYSIVEIATKLAAAYDGPELIGAPLKTFLAHVLVARVSELGRAKVLLAERLLPNGFRDLQLSKLFKSPFKSEYRAFAALYLLLCLLGLMSAVTILGTGQGALTQVVRTWSVFWVLMVAVSMTPSFVLSWLALKYAAATGVIQCSITTRSMLFMVANWVSIGGVIGLLTGAITFVPLRFMAEHGLTQQPMSLSILADLSLAGAVGGFIAAHFGVLFASTAAMNNRLVALSFPLLAISLFTSVASFGGINPAANAEYSLKIIRNSVVLPRESVDLNLLAIADWKTLLAVSADSMMGTLPGPTPFAVGVAGAALLVSLLILGSHMRSSLLSAAEERKETAQETSCPIDAIG